jgi:hypothetical protein
MPRDQYLIRLPRLAPQVTLQTLSPWHKLAGDADTPAAELPHDLIPVQFDSPTHLRRAVHTLAGYFQREFHHDQVPWSQHDEEPSTMAFLWCPTPREQSPAIGAACFRARQWKGKPDGYGLVWVWFHPFERRRKHLSRAWPFFKSMFGNFVVEAPRSLSMEAFLAKQAALAVKPA